MFQRYTAVYGALKKQFVTTVETVFLPPIKDLLTGFGTFMALDTNNCLFRDYRAIDKIDLEENLVKMIRPYKPAEPLAQLI